MKHLALLSLLALFPGCATTSSEVKAQLATLPAVETTRCTASDCALQWQRAQVWITRHSVMKVQTATDVMIQTFGSQGETNYSFVVTREPMPDGESDVRIEVVCGTTSGKGCAPPIADVKRAFFHYLQTGEDVLDGKDLTTSSLR